MSKEYDDSDFKTFGRNWTERDWERVNDAITVAGGEGATLAYYEGGFWKEHMVKTAAGVGVASILKGRVKIWDSALAMPDHTVLDEKGVPCVLLSTARHGSAPSGVSEEKAVEPCANPKCFNVHIVHGGPCDE